ncbi:MAG: ABC transporter permease [Promethearchaeota archaeon]
MNKFTKARNSLIRLWPQVVLVFSLAQRNIARSKYRTLLIIFGIVLTIALETGIVITIDTLYDDFILDNRNNNYTDLTVLPTKWTDLSNLRALAKNIESFPKIAKTSPVYSLYSRNILLSQVTDSKILIYGIDPTTHPDFSSLNITDGNRLVEDNIIILSQSILKMTGLKLNETIIGPPGSGFESINFTIGGVISDISFFGNNFGNYFILVDIETLYDLVPIEEKEAFLSPKIHIQVKDFLDIKKIGNTLKNQLGVDYHVWVEKSVSPLKISGIKSYQSAMNIVILASFVVEFLFITNILAISIRDRNREFGILRAVGSNTRQLIETITVEILIYSTIGSFLGLLVGIGFAWILLDILQNFYTNLVIENFILSPISLLATFLSGIIVAIISGLYPIFIAISMPVVQNIHSRMRRGKSKYSHFFPIYWKYTVGMGALLALTGFMLQFFVGPSRFLAFEVLSIHFLVILLIFIGTLFVEIGILYFLPRIAFKLLIWFGPVIRTISMRNISREFQKSLFTIMTSTLSLTFIILVGLVSAAVVAGVPGFFEAQWGAIDLIAEGYDGNLPSMDLINELNNVDGIARSSFIQEQRIIINNATESYIFGVNTTQYEYFAEEVIDSLIVDTSAYYWLNQTIVGNHSTLGTYGVISHLLQQRLFVPLGSNLSIRIGHEDSRTINITIMAVIKSNAFLENGEYIYISMNRFQEFFNKSDAKWFICEVNGNIKKVENHLNDFPQFKEILKVEYFTEVMERSLIFQSVLFQVLFIESFILAAITQFICILVSTLRMEREVGILRSLGLHKRGVLGVFLAESTALGFSAAILGLIDGLLGSFLLAWYISLSIPIKIQLAFNYILLWLIFSILVTQLSAFLPSYRSSRRNIVAAISGRPMTKNYRESVKLREFLSENLSQLQVAFLFLLGISSCMFIFNNVINILGLVPFDLLLFITFLFLNIESLNGVLLAQNPLILVIGLASIGPISYLIVHNSFPSNFAKELIKSVAWGLISCFILLCSFIAMIGFNILLLDLLRVEHLVVELGQRVDWLESNLLANFIRGFVVSSFLIIILLELLIFQRIWAFIVIRGFTMLSLKQKIIWVKNKGGTGQFRIIGISIGYVILQAFFIIISSEITNISRDPYILHQHPALTLLYPLMFTLITIIEICIFLLFISIQIINYKNTRLQIDHYKLEEDF